MAAPPTVLILSQDELLGDLLAERFRQDHVHADHASSVTEAAASCRDQAPDVVVIDAIVDGALASWVLDDPRSIFGEAHPPLMLLAGSGTPAEIRDHNWFDRVVAAPLPSDAIVQAALYCAGGRARRVMHSGVRLRSAVVETFKTKTRSLSPKS
jgi:hypothetical protein